VNDGDIHEVARVLREEYGRWREPIVTELAHDRYPFSVLVSCMISLRTKDDVTREATKRLLASAPDPESLASLPPKKIEEIIFPAGFYRVKARNLRDIGRLIAERYGGRVPDDIDELLTLPGVGRKTANLVVTKGYGKPGICVDTHVHRICNRLGYVRTKNPTETEYALRDKLPTRYWIEINDLLVTYGQNLCTPVSPHCSRCRIAVWCERVGVTRSR
jgi:endonuclease-3